MPPTVECCISNCAPELRAAVGDEVTFRERRCLEHCGICQAERFAVVDGRLLTEPDLSSLVDGLKSATTECQR